MRNLDELRWEQFHIGDIFSVERPSARNKDRSYKQWSDEMLQAKR